MDNIVSRVFKAVIMGLVAGVITALIVWVISALLPGVELDSGFWGTVVGVLYGLYYFFTNGDSNL